MIGFTKQVACSVARIPGHSFLDSLGRLEGSTERFNCPTEMNDASLDSVSPSLHLRKQNSSDWVSGCLF